MPAIAVAAAAAGLTMAPVSSVLRSIWPIVAGADGAKTAYALDAALQEVIFVGGPLLVAVLAVISPVAAVAGAAVLAAVGTYAFARLPPVRAAGPAEERHTARLGALSAVGVRTLALLSLWLGLGFGAAEIAVPAFAEAEGNRALAGVALAGFSAGSLVGGLLAGLRPSRDERRRIILGTIALTGLMALPLAARSMGSMAVLLFVAGLPIAPVVAAIYGQIGRVAAAGSVAEAFSWFGTAVSVGIAGGSVAGGWLIDAHGWRAAVLLGIGCLGIGALLTALRRGTLGAAFCRRRAERCRVRRGVGSGLAMATTASQGLRALARAARPHAGPERRALLDPLGPRRAASRNPGHRRDRLRPPTRLSRRLSVHPRRLPVDVPRAAVDDAPVRGLRLGRGDQRAISVPARPRADGAVDGVRHADADGARLGPRAFARRGRQRGGGRRLGRRHARPVRGHPARRGLDVDDDQLACRDAAGLLRLRRRGAGRAAVGSAGHDPDRHPEGVHRAEGVHLPARAEHAARHGHGRVLHARDAALASDLDLGVPHPRGGLDGGAGARVHAAGRLHLRGVGARARARGRRVRAPAVVLLQRAPRLLRGDRQVPSRPADLGDRAARSLRRQGRALPPDALPRPDGRRLADGAAARAEHRSHGDRGARGRARRHAVAPHELASTRRWRSRRRMRSGSPSAPSR